MEYGLGITIETSIADTFVGGLTPDMVLTAARQALNRIADRGRTKADRLVRSQVAFPARYLGPSAKRLWVQTRASNASLQATIRGQGRPTSLARFSKEKPLTGGARHKDGRVAVTVHPGQTKYVQRAFLIELRNSNIGLAVRTNGGPPPGAYKPKELAPNLWLLYGPSVDQTLLDAQQAGGIYTEISGELLDEFDAEFQRLIDKELAK